MRDRSVLQKHLGKFYFALGVTTRRLLEVPGAFNDRRKRLSASISGCRVSAIRFATFRAPFKGRSKKSRREISSSLPFKLLLSFTRFGRPRTHVLIG